MKKVKQKTVDQLHEEIMALFVGQKIENTIFALVETLVCATKTLEIPDARIMTLISQTMIEYDEAQNGTKN